MSGKSQLVPLDQQPDQIIAMTERLRLALYDSIKESDVTAMMGKIVEKAKQGDPKAISTVLDYVVGGKASHHVSVKIDKTGEHANVKQIHRLEPLAERLHRSLSLVMDGPPPAARLALLTEAQLEQAERWAQDQAHALRRMAKGETPALPTKPEFLGT